LADKEFIVRKGLVVANTVIATYGSNVGIGTATAAFSLDMGSRTDSILLPQGNTAQRAGANGSIRYNTENLSVEVLTEGSWANVISGSTITILDDDTFATANSTTVPSSESAKAYVDNSLASFSVGGPSVGTNGIIRTNAKNIIEDITLSDHSTTFTATAAANTISVGTDDGFANGDTIYMTSTTTLPAGLATNTEYYVINTTASTSKLSATYGGTEIDITDAGTGTHTIYQAINGMSAGLITIETGFTVTIPDGSTWTII
jgi:hypothetical protein